MSHHSINNEKYDPSGEIVLTIDFEHDLSIDIISVDKCVFVDSIPNNRGFEARIYDRCGSSDYSPMELHWKEVPTEDYLMKFDFSNWIDEKLEEMESER